MGGRENSHATRRPSAAALYGQGWAQEGLEGWSALETTRRGSNRGSSLPLCLSASEGLFQPRTGSRARGTGRARVCQTPGRRPAPMCSPDTSWKAHVGTRETRHGPLSQAGR